MNDSRTIATRTGDPTALASALVLVAVLLPVSVACLFALVYPLSLWQGYLLWLIPAYYCAVVLMFLPGIEDFMWRLAVRGLREPTAAEQSRLRPAWLAVLGAAGQARTSKYRLRVLETGELNAMAAGGRQVFITSGALGAMPDAWLPGVLAHELGHHVGPASDHAQPGGVAAAPDPLDPHDRKLAEPGVRLVSAARPGLCDRHDRGADLVLWIPARGMGASGRDMGAPVPVAPRRTTGGIPSRRLRRRDRLPGTTRTVSVDSRPRSRMNTAAARISHSPTSSPAPIPRRGTASNGCERGNPPTALKRLHAARCAAQTEAAPAAAAGPPRSAPPRSGCRGRVLAGRVPVERAPRRASEDTKKAAARRRN